MTGTRALRVLTSLSVVLAALTGCTPERSTESAPASQPAAEVALTAPEAGELRLTLEHHFGLHAHLIAEAARLQQRPRKAAAATIDTNTTELSAAVRSAYDQQAADDFVRVWNRHVAALGDYTQGAAKGKPSDKSRAAALRSGNAVATFMADVTDEGMQPDGTQALLRSPTRELLDMADAYGERDYTAAYTGQREAFAEMVAVGRAFAAGISEHLPDRYPGARSSGPLELRSALRQLLVEHAVLTTTVLRRSAGATKDFPAAAAALNGNTEDLLTALDSIYSTSSDELGGQWRDRISLLAEYTVAVVEEPKRRGRHRRAVHNADDDVAVALAGLTEDSISRTTLRDALREHTTAALAHIDAFVDRDFPKAQERAAEAYRTSADLADVIAEGIVAHRPEEFPTQ